MTDSVTGMPDFGDTRNLRRAISHRMQTPASRPASGSELSALVPYAALLAAMVAFATGSSAAKQLFPLVGAAGTTFYRVGFAAVLLMAMWRPWRRRWTRGELLLLGRYGVVLGMMNLSFYLSLRTIPLGLAIAIELLGPLSVALFNSRRLIHFAWIALALAGLALLLPVGGVQGGLDPLGIGFALCAALCWGLYIVFGKRVVHLHPGHAVAMGMTFAALAVAPFGIAAVGADLLDLHAVILGLVVAVLSSALPYSLEMVSLRHIPERTYGVVLSIDPAIGALAGYVLLGEVLSGRQLIALACVICAAIGAVLTREGPAPTGAEAMVAP